MDCAWSITIEKHSPLPAGTKPAGDLFIDFCSYDGFNAPQKSEIASYVGKQNLTVRLITHHLIMR